MTRVRDAAFYSELSKSLPEKVGFIKDALRDAPPLDAIVDFGCGDGSLLTHIGAHLPWTARIGVERDEHHRDLLRSTGHCNVSSDLLAASRYSETFGDNRLLIMSSVLHEIPKLHDVLVVAASCGFKYVAIRDFDLMAPYSNRYQVAEGFNDMLRHMWPDEDEVYFRRLFLENFALEHFRGYTPILLRRTRPLWVDRALREHIPGFLWHCPPGLTTHLELVLERDA